MNKRDFYKELMSEYQFDKDKILTNAKKGRFAGRSPMPIYIGITAAAAVAVVGVGTMLFTSLGGDKGVDLLTGNAITALSNKERIEKAIEDVKSYENSGELHDVLVTFAEPLTTAEAQRVLTEKAEGSVPVKMLYFSDETRVVGADAVGEAFEKGEGLVTGAVINCAGYLMEQLHQSSEVFAVEIITADDDLNVIAPINTSDPEIEDVIPSFSVNGGSTADTPVTDNTSTEGDNSGASLNISDNSETSDDGSESNVDSDDSGDSSDIADDTSSDGGESSENSDGGESSENSENGEGSDNSSDTFDVSVIPTVPEIDEIPSGVTLLENVDGIFYTTDDIGASDAFFVSDNTFFVLTDSGADIYRFNGRTETLAASLACDDAKIEWVAEDGSGILISATDEGRRSLLYYADTRSRSFEEINVSGVVMTGCIKDVVYNSGCGILALGIVDEDFYYACTLTLKDGAADYLADCYGSTNADVSIIAVNDKYVYFFENSEDGGAIVRTSVNDYSDGEEVCSEESTGTGTANFAGTYAAVTFGDSSYIFDPSTETLIGAPAGGSISFGVSRNAFSCGGGYYAINNGVVSAASGFDIIGEIDWKKSFSEKYQARAVSKRVRITQSSYTTENVQSNIMFNAPAENASAEIRAVVNEALGLQNAISQSKLSDCGIQSADVLIETIDAIYSEQAAETLKARCKILAGGRLSYETGGLGTINVSDTVLLITSDNGSTASGVLYVNVGTFDGSSGYRAVSVRLVHTGAQWKVDAVIE